MSDDSLVTVLKQRKYYTSEAADIAVKEALKRKIIASEADLLSDKFRGKELRFSWFPLSQNSATRLRMRRSIVRSLVICGLIPLVFGFLELNAGRLWKGQLMLTFGLLWIVLSAQLSKKHRALIWGLLLGGMALAFAFVLVQFVSLRSVPAMDVLVALVLFSFISYGLLYLYKMR